MWIHFYSSRFEGGNRQTSRCIISCNSGKKGPKADAVFRKGSSCFQGMSLACGLWSKKLDYRLIFTESIYTCESLHSDKILDVCFLNFMHESGGHMNYKCILDCMEMSIGVTCVYKFFFCVYALEDLLNLFERWRANSFIYWFVPWLPTLIKSDQAEARNTHVSGGGPRTWVILHCLPRDVSRELDRKQNGWDRTGSYVGYLWATA